MKPSTHTQQDYSLYYASLNRRSLERPAQGYSLSGRIRTDCWGWVHTNNTTTINRHTGNLGALFEVEIFNAGAPTVVKDWAFTVLPTNKPPVSGLYASIPLNLELENPKPGLSISSNLFFAVAPWRIIPSGGMVRAWISFAFPTNLNTIYVAEPAAGFIIEFRDVADNRYAIKGNLTGDFLHPLLQE